MKLATLFLSASIVISSFVGVAHAQPMDPRGGNGTTEQMQRAALSPVNIQGTIAQYITGPRGHVRALTLTDGTIVRIARGQGDGMSQRVAVGQTIRIQGFTRANQPGTARMIVRATIFAPDGTVLAQPQPRGAQGQGHGRGMHQRRGGGRWMGANRQAIMNQLQPMNLQGTVQSAMTGRQGHLRGLLLANGTRVILPRPLAMQIGNRVISAGENLQIQGRGGTIGQQSVIVAQQVTFANGGSYTMPTRQFRGQPRQ